MGQNCLNVNLGGKELYLSDASSGSCAEELKNPSRGVESTGQSSKVARLSCGTFFILNMHSPLVREVQLLLNYARQIKPGQRGFSHFMRVA